MISSSDVVGSTQLPFVLLGAGLTSALAGSAQICYDRNSCRNSSYIGSASFLISSINYGRILFVISALVCVVGEEDECRGAAPKYSLIPTLFSSCTTTVLRSSNCFRYKNTLGALLNQGILQETKII